MRIHKFFNYVKYFLASRCEDEGLEHSLLLGLELETDDKEISNHQVLQIFERLARSVVESPDESQDVVKIKKYYVVKICDLMSWGMPGDETNERIEKMSKLVCDSGEKISLDVLAKKMVETFEECCKN
ncbi:hypothetical protein GCK72_007755 [Caenorhabditis remanei]|uniref:SPK domain-containing protein n=1 Tax=Caenorhabditis remanei TaxID=31234 RepID=A0A6A5HM93_CAERE|nr:hypothetical protein GCK72_007755 [Caenorhabditis remanei]KAF1767796.1 hypothetical protein GCK72_007755 [Caenorhabditis remanei]